MYSLLLTELLLELDRDLSDHGSTGILIGRIVMLLGLRLWEGILGCILRLSSTCMKEVGSIIPVFVQLTQA